MSNLQALLDDPDFLDLPEYEQDSMIASMQGSKEPGMLSKAVSMAGNVLKPAMERTVKAGPTSFNSLTGGVGTEFAHNAKVEALLQSGIAGKSSSLIGKLLNKLGISHTPDPENLAQSFSSGTDPQSLLAPLLGKASKAGMRQLELGSANAMENKAKTILTQNVIQPKISKSGDLFARPEVEQAVSKMKPVKNYQELADLYKGESMKPMAAREEIYKSTLASPEKSQLNQALELLQEKLKNKRVRPQEKKAVKEVMGREQEALKEGDIVSQIDPDELQKVKEFYQTKSQPLYKKRDMGTITGNESAELEMYERLAKGYQTKLESLDPRVKGLNREWQGLDEASNLSQAKQNEFLTTPQPNTVEKIVDAIPFINRFLPLNEARKLGMKIAKSQKDLPASSKQIYQLIKEVTKIRSKK